MIEPAGDARLRGPLPKKDDGSTPFAEALLHLLPLFPGAAVLDADCGAGPIRLRAPG